MRRRLAARLGAARRRRGVRGAPQLAIRRVVASSDPPIHPQLAWRTRRVDRDASKRLSGSSNDGMAQLAVGMGPLRVAHLMGVIATRLASARLTQAIAARPEVRWRVPSKFLKPLTPRSFGCQCSGTRSYPYETTGGIMAVAPAPSTATDDSPRRSGTARRLGITDLAATLQGRGPSRFDPRASSAPDDPLSGSPAVA